MHETVSVILPVNRWHARTDAAIESILDQRGVDVELFLVTNGDDDSICQSSGKVAAAYPNVEHLHSPPEGLPAALNAGLRACRTPLVARMDADDWSHPHRLARQSTFLRENPSLGGCGCGAEFVRADGTREHLVVPPLTARQARWRLLLSNAFVHGSMMLRREIVLEVGGYNEAYRRAQDYDLWLRLAHRGLGGVPDILYTYLIPENTDGQQLDREQADATAKLLLDAWSTLPDQEPPELGALMARLLRNDVGARAQLESVMERDGPTRQTIQAWMWSCRQHPIQKTDTTERIARARAAREMLASASVEELWLWGAGDLARMLSGSDLLGVPIVGFADDARAGEKLSGKIVRAPEELPLGSSVLIASDLYEDTIWERSAPLRAKGIQVFRMPSP